MADTVAQVLTVTRHVTKPEQRSASVYYAAEAVSYDVQWVGINADIKREILRLLNGDAPPEPTQYSVETSP